MDTLANIIRNEVYGREAEIRHLKVDNAILAAQNARQAKEIKFREDMQASRDRAAAVRAQYLGFGSVTGILLPEKEKSPEERKSQPGDIIRGKDYEKQIISECVSVIRYDCNAEPNRPDYS
mgnify:CR=1 FL=1